MEELRALLANELAWIDTTDAAEVAAVTLTRAQIITLLKSLPKREPDLPKIEPRLLHPQEPRGTRRSPEEIARVLAERYGQTEEIRAKVLKSCA